MSTASMVATRVAKFTEARTPGTLFSLRLDPAGAGCARHAGNIELDPPPGAEVGVLHERSRHGPPQVGMCGLADLGRQTDTASVQAVSGGADGRVLTDEGTQAPRAGHASEFTFAAVGEPVPGAGDDVAHCRGHQHLAGPRQRRDARSDVHGHARDVITTNLDLAGVDADPDLDTQHADRVDQCVAARQGGLGLVNVATNPSPAVLTSRPPNRWISWRTMVSWLSSRSRHRLSPSIAARSVEPTMSVNTMVVSTRSASPPPRTPVTNSSISSSIGAASPTQYRVSSPGSSTSVTPRCARRDSGRARPG